MLNIAKMAGRAVRRRNKAMAIPLFVFLIGCLLPLPTRYVEGSALPGHRQMRDGLAKEKMEFRHSRQCSGLRITPFRLAILSGAAALLLLGVTCAIWGLFCFRRKPQPAPKLFLEGEVLAIYRYSATSGALGYLSFIVLFAAIACDILRPDTTNNDIWALLLSFAALSLLVYGAAYSGIPAKIESAKLEQLTARLGRIEVSAGGGTAEVSTDDIAGVTGLRPEAAPNG